MGHNYDKEFLGEPFNVDNLITEAWNGGESVMNNLLPCPFCGGKVEIDMLDSENSRNVKIYSAVHCPECHEWFFKGLSRGKTIERWNRRTQPEVYIGVDLASGQDFTFCAGNPERSEE